MMNENVPPHNVCLWAWALLSDGPRPARDSPDVSGSSSLLSFLLDSLPVSR